VPIKDPLALRKAILYVISNYQKLLKRTILARKLVEKKYSMQKMLAEYEHIFS